MRTFKFTVFHAGAGAECFSFNTKHKIVAPDKEAAKAKLAKEEGWPISYLEEGEYCKIEEIAA